MTPLLIMTLVLLVLLVWMASVTWPPCFHGGRMSGPAAGLQGEPQPQSESGTFARVKDSLRSAHLTGVGTGAFTCLTGDGDCWRPAATLATRGVGDLEVGLGRTLGGAL